MCPQGGQLLDQSGSLASFWDQTSALTRRSFRNMYRDLGYYWLRLIIYIALGISIGTVFQNVGTSWNSIRVSRVLPMNSTAHYMIRIYFHCYRVQPLWQNARQFLSMWWTKSITLWKNCLIFSWIPSQYVSPIHCWCNAWSSEDCVTVHWQSRAGSMTFMTGFLTFMSIGGFPSFVEDLKVIWPLLVNYLIKNS